MISIRLRERFKGGSPQSSALMAVMDVLREHQNVGGCQLSAVITPKKRAGMGRGSKDGIRDKEGYGDGENQRRVTLTEEENGGGKPEHGE